MRNFKDEINGVELRLKGLGEELKAIKSDLKTYSQFTQKFLNECGKEGITRVSIGARSKKVPATLDWPFGHSGSVFQFPSGRDGKNGWVAIWEVVEKLGISCGCGNSDQHNVVDDANLIEGVFELKNKKWRKVED